MSEEDNTVDMGLDFVNALHGGDFRSAESMFNDMLADKVQSTLDAEKIAVAGQIFNDEEDDLDLLDDELVDDLDDDLEEESDED